MSRADQTRDSRSRPGDDSDLSLGKDVPGHDSHLALLGDHTGTVSTDHPGLVLAPEGVVDHQLVPLGDPFGDGDDQGDLGLDGFEDGTGGKGRRDVDDGSVGVLLVLGLLDASVDGETEMGLAGFLRGSSGVDHGGVSLRVLGEVARAARTDGLTPQTYLEPKSKACLEWKVPCLTEMQWTLAVL